MPGEALSVFGCGDTGPIGGTAAPAKVPKPKAVDCPEGRGFREGHVPFEGVLWVLNLVSDSMGSPLRQVLCTN
jgi:hypothetical protein